MILGASMTVPNSIACREAGILPPNQRFRCLLFQRTLCSQCLDSRVHKKICEPQPGKHNFIKYCVICKRIPLPRTVACLKLTRSKKSGMKTERDFFNKESCLKATRECSVAFQRPNLSSLSLFSRGSNSSCACLPQRASSPTPKKRAST